MTATLAGSGFGEFSEDDTQSGDTRSRRRNILFICIALAAYAAFVAVCTHYHEPWRDEADTWLAARDLSLSQLFRYCAYVGSPCLTYLIYMPFAQGGGPYASMGWVNAALAVGAAFVVLRFAPFPKLVRVLVIFGYYLAYEYAAIARGYSLLALLLFSTAAVFRRRREWAITLAVFVFLLFNSTTHGAMFAGVITALLIWETIRNPPAGKRWMIALAIMAAGGIAAAMQLWPPTDSQRPGFWSPAFADAPYEVLTRMIAIPLGPKVIDPVWLIVNLAALAICAAYLARRPAILAMWAGGTLAMMYVFAFKWCIPERHAGILFLWLLFALWVARDYPMSDLLIQANGRIGRLRWDGVMIALGLALVPACVKSGIAAVAEVRVEYSQAGQMGRFIVAGGYDRGRIAASNISEAVVPYLRCRTVWNVNTGRETSYNKWDQVFQQNWEIFAPATVWERFEKQFPDPATRPALVWDQSLPLEERHGFRLAYRTTGPVGPSGERFYFYVPIERQSLESKG